MNYFTISILFLICSFVFLYFVLFFSGTSRGKGKTGEFVSMHFLKKLNPSEYKILNDLTLKIDDKLTQIDHVVVSIYGIFVIETKIRAGKIYGDVKKPYWTQYIGGKKFSMRNPIHQNYGHVQFIKQILNEYPNIEPISLVVFSGNTIKKIYGDTTIKISQICNEIKKYNEPTISLEDRDRIYKKLKVLEKEGRNKEIQKKHIAYVKERKAERKI